MDLSASAQAQRKLPHRVRKKSGEYRPGADAIQVMTMHASKGLEWPVVAVIENTCEATANLKNSHGEPRLTYVAATRASHGVICF